VKEYRVGYVYLDKSGMHKLGRCRFSSKCNFTTDMAKDHIEAETGEKVTLIRYCIPCD